jgi:iron complex outermembrane receptor protein
MGQMKTGYTSKSFYFATISAVALIHGAASAQTAPASDSSVTGAAQDVAPTALDVVDPTPTDSEIVVTGSRIARPEIDSPSPVVSISSATLEQSGRTNLTDFLVQNPALLGSTTSANQSGSTASFGGAGTNLLNLRNLGSNRTLVLVDGRRHVAGLPGTAAVDINTIPKDLIESTEILTGGGGSAIYGADGVSGVVNFKLKRDFEGLRVRGQAGATEDGDAGNRFFAITGGKNFADGRGNVALSYEFTDDDRRSPVTQIRRRSTQGPTVSCRTTSAMPTVRETAQLTWISMACRISPVTVPYITEDYCCRVVLPKAGIAHRWRDIREISSRRTVSTISIY